MRSRLTRFHGNCRVLLIALAVAAGAMLFAQGTGGPALPAQAAFDLGVQLRTKGNSLGSRVHFQAALDAAAREGNSELVQRSLFGLADVEGDLSDWAGMLDYAQRAYDARPEPKGRARARYLDLKGRVFQELREREQAMAAYREGLELAKAIDDQVRIGGFYNELGLMAWRLDRDEATALRYYEESLAIWERLRHDRNIVVVMNNSGNIFKRPGGYAEAERRYRIGLAAADRAGIQDAMLLKNFGVVLRETGRRAEARQVLERAVHLADTMGSGRIQWQGRMELGTFYAPTDPPRAADYYEQTLGVLEGLNSNVLLEGFRAGALSGAVTINDDPYDLYTDLLLNDGREREAFLVAECARARAFLDTLSTAREEIAKALPEDFVRDERSILESISGRRAALRAPDLDPARRRSLQAAVREDEERLTQIRVRLATKHPALAQREISADLGR